MATNQRPTRQTADKVNRIEYPGDREDLEAIMGVLYRLYPTRRLDYDTKHMNEWNRAKIGQIIEELPTEELDVLAQLARLLLIFPEQSEHAINYQGEQNRRFMECFEITGDAVLAASVAG